MIEPQKTLEIQVEALELVRLKASELVTRFSNYLKDKTFCGGRIGLEAEQDGHLAVLKVASVQPSAMDRYCSGMRVLLAYYDEEKGACWLKRYSRPVGGRQDAIPVGSYGSTDDLMQAVADEVAEL